MASDDAIKQIAHIPASEPLPHVSLDTSLCKTKEIVQAVQNLQKQQEEADKKASKEIRSHAQTKEKIKQAEVESARARELMEKELKEHELTKEKLNRAEREHMKTKQEHETHRHEVSSMLLQMEALKVEMEAQRKAFVVNVNWASRCTELKAKFDTSRKDYDKLYDQHVSTRAALEEAAKAQAEYRMKATSTQEVLEQARKELARQAEELQNRTGVTPEVQKNLEEWQKYKDAEAAEAISKKHGRSKAMGVLERQLAQGDAGLMMSMFTGWATFVVDEAKRKKYKDQAMKRAMKTIANEGLGLMSQCFGPWRKDTEQQKRHAIELANRKLEEANARSGGGAEIARKRALEQLEKQFIGQDKALTKAAFQAWASGQAMRKKKDANLQKGARMIANSSKALQAEIFLVWNAETEKTRVKNKQKEGNHKKAARMIANSSKALVADIFQTWAQWVGKLAEDRKKKAAGNAKAARMMANSDTSLMNICFDSWGKLLGEKKKKDAGNKKAARMIAGSGQALVVAVFKDWAKMCNTKKAKEQNTAKAVRMIAASGQALQAACFQSWAVDIRKNKEKNKKLRAVEKTIGASAEGLKLLIVTSWRNTTIVESRKKRGKERGMASSMKSINGNQDMLLTHVLMSWARVIAKEGVQKLQEKVKKAEEELEEAMIAATKAVEEDVGRCQEEVERLKGELEAVKKQYNEAVAKAENLGGQIEEANAEIANRDRQLNSLVAELEQSRQKARDIGEELAKVGIFLQSATPKQKGSRPRSGAKAKDDGTLPKIGKEPGRPQSGRSGSKGTAPKQAWDD